MNPTTITMDSDKNITANFEETPVYTLTTSAEGGTIKLIHQGPQYNEGTVVKVEALQILVFSSSNGVVIH